MINTELGQLGEKEYKRRIRAWTMYDWANSAFATTIMAAVLPVYYSQVAGATLPSPAIATAYWSTGLSISLLIVAVLSPILGTISDVMRGKKKFLSVFFGIGIVGTGLLVLVDTGDWMLASLLFIFGRIGFTGANVFYDSLLPHIAKEEDLDIVSTRGYAMGYLGGGILLAVNIVMIQVIPGTWGVRLSFLSVALWWAIFAIPIFRQVPEPLSATSPRSSEQNVVSLAFKRLAETIKDVRQYRELFKYLVAFLIYIDGIGTIIGVAAIYGAELGIGSIELIAALLLVQFVGIPYSLIFGRLPSKAEKRRAFFLAFVLFNIVALPLAGILGSRLLAPEIVGTAPDPYLDTVSAVGEGIYSADDKALSYTGEWSITPVSASDIGAEEDAEFMTTSKPGSEVSLSFNGKEVLLYYVVSPDGGIWSVLLDGEMIITPEDEFQTIDTYNSNIRYSESVSIIADDPGEHTLSLKNISDSKPGRLDSQLTIERIEVLAPIRNSNLLFIIGLILAVEVLGLVFALLLGKPLFNRLAQTIDTKRGILIALLIYSVVAVWGYFLNSVIEFWFLAWMVAVVQGGSQALSRSLFSVMAPAAKSGEFFGLFGIMEKFSAIVGPLIFAWAATTFGSSRPAVLSIIAFFIIGGYLLTKVNVEEGREVARAEDASLLKEMQNDTVT